VIGEEIVHECRSFVVVRGDPHDDALASVLSPSRP